MTASKSRPGATTAEPDTGDHIGSEASLDSKTSRTEIGPDDIAPQDARKEGLRNAGRGDQFVVASDLEDSDQRDAAPGTREQE